MADQRFDLCVAAAVLGDKIQVHQQPGLFLARHRQRGHLFCEFDVQNLEYRPCGKWVFIDQFQDEIALLPKAVTLTLGTKVEHNDLTGLVVQACLFSPAVELVSDPVIGI